MLLRRHNLNLVPILRELLRTRSVSRTAELVGLSQSAVSAALARLRVAFGDELLVPSGRGLALTARGAALIEPAERAVAELEALLQPAVFDPASQTRQFVVATADYISMLMASRVTALLSRSAPMASVAFIDVPPALIGELQQGSIDFAILPEGTVLERDDRIERVHLFDDEMVVIASRRLKPFSGPLTLDTYQRASHAAFQMARRVDPTLAMADFAEPPVVQHKLAMVQQYSSLPAIVESTACLAFVQQRLARRMQRLYDIEIFPPPFPHEPLRIGVCFSRAAATDPGHRWFLNILTSALPENGE